MGDNRDLSWDFGLPADTACPQCGRTIHDPYDDYDIECGNPNLKRGTWVLRVWCTDCDTTWYETWELSPKKIHSEVIKSV